MDIANKLRSFAGVCCALFLLFSADAGWIRTAAYAAEAQYQYEKIVDTNGPFWAISNFAMNNKGTVVFRAWNDDGGTGIYTGKGGETELGEYVTIADTDGPFAGFRGVLPSINDDGLVAFRAYPDTGGLGIFVGEGGDQTFSDYTRIALTAGPFSDLGPRPLINKRGAVSFIARADNGTVGVFSASRARGAVNGYNTIAEADGIPFVGFSGFHPPYPINDRGKVAFQAFLYSGENGIFTGDGDEFALTDYVKIAGTGDIFLWFGDDYWINNRGKVVFRAVPSDPTDYPFGNEGIFVGDGSETSLEDYREIANTSGAYDYFFGLALNNRLDVAFHAFLDGGGNGIFTGPDVVADKVIQTGDTLFGSTVVDLGLLDGGLNDNGQIVFFARLANGTRAIVRAGPAFLDFPLAQYTAYDAPIRSVFDHNVRTVNGKAVYYKLNGVVEAYTGEVGLHNCKVGNCIYDVNEYKNNDGTPFSINDQYTAGEYLSYDGHPGYDYPATIGTPILAPADGYLFIPESDPITSESRSKAVVEKFHIMAMDHGNGYFTWYLHVGREKGTIGHPAAAEDFRLIRPGDPPIFVPKGTLIGRTGNKGLCKEGKTQTHTCPATLSHLHFEVRTGLTERRCDDTKCQVIDPYGPAQKLWLDENPS